MEGAANKPTSIQRKEFPNFSFAFNESRFSDRTLHIEISIKYDGPKCLQQDDNGNRATEVGTVQVSSAILAESSQFFNKLFSIGMRETKQRYATIHISPSEEQGFMYLLKFIYGGKIETQSTKELLDVLMLADKYEVPSCIHECTNALDSKPMTMEFASLLLCLPSSLLTTDVMRPKVKAAEGFLLTNFSKRKFTEEYINLPLHVIEELLKSDELCVTSEYQVYRFARDWAKRHYHDQDERKEVFQNKLISLIRFPQMTDHNLAYILDNEDMHKASSLALISKALNFKGGCESYNLEDKSFCKRSYKRTPIRVIELHKPKMEYRVFWDFNKDGEQRSQYFYMWGRRFNLGFFPPRRVYVFLFSDGKDELTHPVEYVVFLRSKLSNEFCEVSRGKLTLVNRKMYVSIMLNNNMENYSFDNVMHVQLVFT